MVEFNFFSQEHWKYQYDDINHVKIENLTWFKFGGFKDEVQL